FDVSRTTIRNAINEMVQEGLLENRQGKGTTVRSEKLVGSLGRLTGFAEEVVEKGYSPYYKLIRMEFRDSLFTEKKMLQLHEDDSVAMIERIRFVDEEPIAFERTCWPEKIGNILQKHDLSGAKFYEILE